MKFLIITHVNHFNQGNSFFAYEPYVKEMNIWLKHVDEVEILAPCSLKKRTNLDLAYNHKNLVFTAIPSIEFTSIVKIFTSLVKLPYILSKMYSACKRSDHIHLRCPGNIGLLGCCIQIMFPKKTKTAKYAGNWDPRSKQPLSYKIQKYILNNTFLTKNMQTLVYGNWKNMTRNIKPFFTATYRQSEIEDLIKRNYLPPYRFVFVGTLVPGKRPLLTVKIVESLFRDDIECTLDIYGDGNLRHEISDYVIKNDLNSVINIHGNVSREFLKTALKNSDFIILPSRSEGWPKAVAEAMFFGVIPVTTKISCLGWMLDEGRRGILIEKDLNLATAKVREAIYNENLLSMSIACQKWSNKYTLDRFEGEIKKLLSKE